ncbi:MAG: TRAP transporter small permease [Alphaproteobacteria bacterium]|nr:TRAP transporter small permease [Alphaproteobacteria bacterium]
MLSLFRPLDRLVHLLAYYLGGVLLVFLVLVTNVDVTLRKTQEVFGNPLFHGAHDFSRISLLLIVGVALGYGARTGGNISVEILDSFLPRSITRWVHFVIRLFSAGLLAVAAYKMVEAGFASARYLEGSYELNIPLQPFYYVFAVGIGLYALVQLCEGITLAVDGEVTLMVDESSEMGAYQERDSEQEEAV